ncbi:MAG: DUF2189 domain-containing protein [Gemmobacter sp.]
MTDVDTAPPPGATAPTFRRLEVADLSAALADGWADFRRAPQFGVFFAAVYVVMGLAIVWALAETGQFWWIIPAAFGFPLLAPFIATGLYEVSRRLGTGEALDWGAILRAPGRHGNGQIPALAALMVVFFMMWLVVARVVLAVFQGTGSLPNVTQSLWSLVTPEGITLILIGGAMGAVIAFVLFATQFVSLPMLLDRDIDFVTAMIASVTLVRENLAVSLRWAVIIAVLTMVAMIPAFLGLFIVLPVLGHATWHLYRRAIA